MTDPEQSTFASHASNADVIISKWIVVFLTATDFDHIMLH